MMRLSATVAHGYYFLSILLRYHIRRLAGKSGCREHSWPNDRKNRTRPPAGRMSGGVVRPAVGLRIIGGKFRGRRLHYSGDLRTRPMKDRLREAIFNLIGPAIRGKHALDLFAGTGALALEAISRGAARATLIEQHNPTADIIRQNIAELGLEQQAEVVVGNTFIWWQRQGKPQGDCPNFRVSENAGLSQFSRREWRPDDRPGPGVLLAALRFLRRTHRRNARSDRRADRSGPRSERLRGRGGRPVRCRAASRSRRRGTCDPTRRPWSASSRRKRPIPSSEIVGGLP